MSLSETLFYIIIFYVLHHVSDSAKCRRFYWWLALCFILQESFKLLSPFRCCCLCCFLGKCTLYFLRCYFLILFVVYLFDCSIFLSISLFIYLYIYLFFSFFFCYMSASVVHTALSLVLGSNVPFTRRKSMSTEPRTYIIWQWGQAQLQGSGQMKVIALPATKPSHPSHPYCHISSVLM